MNNNFFTLCALSNPNAADVYKCCMQTCRSQSSTPHICFSMCAQVFPLIKDRCAFEQECWRDGYYNRKCLEARSTEIHNCCVQRCQTNRRINPYTRDELDCDQYCSDYTLQ